jgi:hypothetical protein
MVESNFECLCLSLKKDIDRRDFMGIIFDKMNIPVTFFDGTTPDKITEDIEVYFKNSDLYEWNVNQKSVMAAFISHTKMLEYSIIKNKNLLIIEDDIDYVLPIDFGNINFDNFDLYNVGLNFSCYSYFVSIEGSEKILNELNNKIITQAYDWELSKLQTIRKNTSLEPHFIQIENKFTSNIAPNGYVRY